MKLSVIIVNYNVKFFLEQALRSAEKACRNVSSEIFVVDNNSVDGSAEMVKEKFPNVKLIENKNNSGFSAANNQAIRKSSGEYVLLLNPDTVVEEDTFEKTIHFMDQHPEAGGLGVKMIDGAGNFLPESKRGLPTPSVAFYKIFGLAALFPKSKIFGKYHLSFLDKEKIHAVDVLSGAFMLLRKATLDKTGLLDEQFFMYGEDIDLSYRITKEGYKNYYFPETCIIHYKGESTKKSSVNYVFVFYRAMIIFAQKHFSHQHAKLFSFLINIAIFIRAFFAITARFLQKILVPLADAILIFGGMLFLKTYWEETVKQAEGLHYPASYIQLVVPVYILIWLLSIYFSGGYDKPIKVSKIFRGIFAGTIFILVVYALLPESWRFSRAIIVLGTVWSVISLFMLRLIFSFLKVKGFSLFDSRKKRTVIAGGNEEAKRVESLLNVSGVNSSIIGFVSTEENAAISGNTNCLGRLDQLPEVIEIYNPDEIIFCSKNISSGTIISLMSQTKSSKAEFKIAPPESLFIIGSNSIENPGDIYTIGINAINRPVNKRNKRLFDVITSVGLLLLFIPLIFAVKNPLGFLINIFNVLSGKKTWVSYKNSAGNLPEIKSGILNPSDVLSVEINQETAARLNMLYAKDYKVYNDLNIVLKAFRALGRS